MRARARAAAPAKSAQWNAPWLTTRASYHSCDSGRRRYVGNQISTGGIDGASQAGVGARARTDAGVGARARSDAGANASRHRLDQRASCGALVRIGSRFVDHLVARTGGSRDCRHADYDDARANAAADIHDGDDKRVVVVVGDALDGSRRRPRTPSPSR